MKAVYSSCTQLLQIWKTFLIHVCYPNFLVTLITYCISLTYGTYINLPTINHISDAYIISHVINNMQS